MFFRPPTYLGSSCAVLCGTTRQKVGLVVVEKVIVKLEVVCLWIREDGVVGLESVLVECLLGTAIDRVVSEFSSIDLASIGVKGDSEQWGRLLNVPDGRDVEERVLEREELVFAGERHACSILQDWKLRWLQWQIARNCFKWYCRALPKSRRESI